MPKNKNLETNNTQSNLSLSLTIGKVEVQELETLKYNKQAIPIFPDYYTRYKTKDNTCVIEHYTHTEKATQGQKQLVYAYLHSGYHDSLEEKVELHHINYEKTPGMKSFPRFINFSPYSSQSSLFFLEQYPYILITKLFPNGETKHIDTFTMQGPFVSYTRNKMLTQRDFYPIEDSYCHNNLFFYKHAQHLHIYDIAKKKHVTLANNQLSLNKLICHRVFFNKDSFTAIVHNKKKSPQIYFIHNKYETIYTSPTVYHLNELKSKIGLVNSNFFSPKTYLHNSFQQHKTKPYALFFNTDHMLIMDKGLLRYRENRKGDTENCTYPQETLDQSITPTTYDFQAILPVFNGKGELLLLQKDSKSTRQSKTITIFHNNTYISIKNPLLLKETSKLTLATPLVENPHLFYNRDEIIQTSTISSSKKVSRALPIHLHDFSGYVNNEYGILTYDFGGEIKHINFLDRNKQVECKIEAYLLDYMVQHSENTQAHNYLFMEFLENSKKPSCIIATEEEGNILEQTRVQLSLDNFSYPTSHYPICAKLVDLNTTDQLLLHKSKQQLLFYNINKKASKPVANITNASEHLLIDHQVYCKNTIQHYIHFRPKKDLFDQIYFQCIEANYEEPITLDPSKSLAIHTPYITQSYFTRFIPLSQGYTYCIADKHKKCPDIFSYSPAKGFAHLNRAIDINGFVSSIYKTHPLEIVDFTSLENIVLASIIKNGKILEVNKLNLNSTNPLAQTIKHNIQLQSGNFELPLSASFNRYNNMICTQPHENIHTYGADQILGKKQFFIYTI